MVLKQRQELVIVSDWKPYLGCVFCVGVCGWLFPVFVFSAPDRTVLGFATFVILYLCSCSRYRLLLNMFNTNYAAFWSSSPSTEENRYNSPIWSNTKSILWQEQHK